MNRKCHTSSSNSAYETFECAIARICGVLGFKVVLANPRLSLSLFLRIQAIAHSKAYNPGFRMRYCFVAFLVQKLHPLFCSRSDLEVMHKVCVCVCVYVCVDPRLMCVSRQLCEPRSNNAGWSLCVCVCVCVCICVCVCVCKPLQRVECGSTHHPAKYYNSRRMLSVDLCL